eukprot:SM000014S00267  [mRNA]  locus=s14:286661:290789:- [translate_table: standard]
MTVAPPWHDAESSMLPGQPVLPEMVIVDAKAQLHTERRVLRAKRPAPECQKPQSKRPGPLQQVCLTPSDGPKIVGRRIKVFWPMEAKYFFGVVRAYNSRRQEHRVVYDDGDEEWLKLDKETFKLQVRGGEPAILRPGHSAIKQRQPEVSGSRDDVAAASQRKVQSEPAIRGGNPQALGLEEAQAHADPLRQAVNGEVREVDVVAPHVDQVLPAAVPQVDRVLSAARTDSARQWPDHVKHKTAEITVNLPLRVKAGRLDLALSVSAAAFDELQEVDVEAMDSVERRNAKLQGLDRQPQGVVTRKVEATAVSPRSDKQMPPPTPASKMSFTRRAARAAAAAEVAEVSVSTAVKAGKECSTEAERGEASAEQHLDSKQNGATPHAPPVKAWKGRHQMDRAKKEKISAGAVPKVHVAPACEVSTLCSDEVAPGEQAPRVGLLKLKRCPANKAVWQVAEQLPSPQQASPKVVTALAAETKRLPDAQARAPALNLPSQSLSAVDILPQGADLWLGKVATPQALSSMHNVSPSPRPGAANTSLRPRLRGALKQPSPVVGGEAEPSDTPQLGEKRSSSPESDVCRANVLVIQSDRGWRERHAAVELRCDPKRAWYLAVVVRGGVMFTYKSEQLGSTSSTNRCSNRIVWRSDKAWSLEFEDRKAWLKFKDYHDDCYRRNLQAAALRQIPIPGVKEVLDYAQLHHGPRFSRPAGRYIRGGQSESESALSSTRIVYDMDSDDEEWLAAVNQKRAMGPRGSRLQNKIAEDEYELVFDQLEKASYSLQEPVGLEAAVDLCEGVATPKVVALLHGRWLERRQAKDLPLVRYFQPPPWVQYQWKLQEWQAKVDTEGSHAELPRVGNASTTPKVSKAADSTRLPFKEVPHSPGKPQRPPLFAFCLRPRGLDSSRLHRQRSHKRQPDRQASEAGRSAEARSSGAYALPSPRARGFKDSICSPAGSSPGKKQLLRKRKVESLQESLNISALPEELKCAMASMDVEGRCRSSGVESKEEGVASASLLEVQFASGDPPSLPVAASPVDNCHAVGDGVAPPSKTSSFGAWPAEAKPVLQSPAFTAEGKAELVPLLAGVSGPARQQKKAKVYRGTDLAGGPGMLAMVARNARRRAVDLRARACALYTVSDAAMRKAVAALTIADALAGSTALPGLTARHD